MGVGLGLHMLEGIQAIVLIPVYAAFLPVADAAFWVALVTSVALVPLALSGHYQPLVRALASRQAADGAARVPAGWDAARRDALATATVVLLVMQAGFAGYLASPWHQLSSHQAVALALFMSAQHLRLRAFGEFMLLAGTGRIGWDKAFLLVTSAVSLLLLSVASLYLASIMAMGAAVLVVHAVLLFVLRRWASQMRSNDPADLPGPPRREIVGLVLLHLGGYLNLGTDVLLATRLLPADEAVQYAFWSRLMSAQLAVVGLWAQVRFPSWAGDGPGSHKAGRDMLCAMAGLGAGCIVLWLARFTMAALPGPIGADFDPTMLAILGCSTFLAGSAMVSGQFLTARRQYRFLWPSVGVACLSPALALGIAASGTPASFVLGYLCVNGVLAAVGLGFAWQVLRN